MRCWDVTRVFTLDAFSNMGMFLTNDAYVQDTSWERGLFFFFYQMLMPDMFLCAQYWLLSVFVLLCCTGYEKWMLVCFLHKENKDVKGNLILLVCELRGEHAFSICYLLGRIYNTYSTMFLFRFWGECLILLGNLPFTWAEDFVKILDRAELSSTLQLCM